MRAGERDGVGGVAPPILIDLERLVLRRLAELESLKAGCFAIGDKAIPNG